jgi:tyrosyl-tRNA synthetase
LSAPPTTTDTVERAVALKMSKSRPDSAIFMTDTEDEIKHKMQKAYCPERIAEENPVLEYCRYILFEKFATLAIERPAKFGGNVTFKSYLELEQAYATGQLHPADLKVAVAKAVNQLLVPVRAYFEKNKEAKKLKELVEGYQVTR